MDSGWTDDALLFALIYCLMDYYEDLIRAVLYQKKNPRTQPFGRKMVPRDQAPMVGGPLGPIGGVSSQNTLEGWSNIEFWFL